MWVMTNQPTAWLSDVQPRLGNQLRFLIEADRLKTVIRASKIADGTRKENTAEHSWHLSLFAIVLAEWSNTPVDVARVVQMLILHDLVELDCGDTPLFEEGASANQVEREREAADRLFGLLPDGQAETLRHLWDEFEAGVSDDAAFAKAIDRFQPILLNHLNRGGTWADYQVDLERERSLTRRIAAGSDVLWNAAEAIFREAIEGGWLLSKPPGSTISTA